MYLEQFYWICDLRSFQDYFIIHQRGGQKLEHLEYNHLTFPKQNMAFLTCVLSEAQIIATRDLMLKIQGSYPHAIEANIYLKFCKRKFCHLFFGTSVVINRGVATLQVLPLTDTKSIAKRQYRNNFKYWDR